MRLVGTYFDLTDRFAPSPAGEVRPVVEVGQEGKGDKNGKGGRVVISVAKRLVPSAVRRNTVKRIVREAWRAAINEASQSIQQGAENSSARASVQDSPAGRVAGSTRVCLVRLKRYPGKDPKAVKHKAVKRRAATPLPAAVSSLPGAPANGAKATAVTGLAAIKRSLRADADQLFAAFLSGRANPRRSPDPRSASFGRGASTSSARPGALKNV